MTSRRAFLLTPLALAAADDIRVGDRLITRVYHDGFPKPFLYPIFAPDGTELSRGWPIAPREGDSKDHTWHRGIWWGHGDINGQDFWREQAGTASLKVKRVQRFGPTAVRIEQDLGDAPLGTVTTTFRFAKEADANCIDAEIRIVGKTALRFGDTDDGGFAVRLREEFRLDRGATMLNSGGATGKAIWGQPAEWTDYSTQVNGKTYGVAILSHPKNLRQPAGWHARPYGLNSANPFAVSSFAEEKGGQRGAYTLEAGNPLVLRYRVLIHDGDAKQARIAERYAAYAKGKKA